MGASFKSVEKMEVRLKSAWACATVLIFGKEEKLKYDRNYTLVKIAKIYSHLPTMTKEPK